MTSLDERPQRRRLNRPNSAAMPKDKRMMAAKGLENSNCRQNEGVTRFNDLLNGAYRKKLIPEHMFYDKEALYD